MKTECGLIGTFLNNPITKEDLWYTLSEIQHRGQDSYGFVSIHPSNSNSNSDSADSSYEVKIKKEKGLLPDIDSIDLNADGGVLFLGHMRYSTNTTVENLDGSLMDCNIQPVEISKEYGIYLAHNGNLPNLKDNMRRLGLEKYYKNGMSDTYLFKVIWNIKFAAKFKQEGKTCKLEDILEYLKYIILNVVGAYSCVMTFCEPLQKNYAARNRTESKTRTSISSLASDTSETSEICDASDSSSDGTINKHRYYLLGFRDRFGYKPLSIGKLVSDVDNSNRLAYNYCFFSESVQLQDNKYFIRDVAPGEIWYSEMNNEPRLLGRIRDKIKNNLVDNNEDEPKSIKNEYGFLCSLEAIYFMKKDTLLFNANTTVNNFRRRLGVELGKQDINKLACELNPEKSKENSYIYEYDARQVLKKRVVFYMPESAYGIAIGYSDIIEARIRNDLISKVQNIRSFIENTTEAREGKLKRKFAFNDKEIVALGNAEIVLIDDTIVRGNSMRYVIGELYKRNPALRIHVRIGSPRLIKGCSFGIDLYDDELIANKESNLAQWLGVASLEFLDISKLEGIFAKYDMLNCTHCFGVSNKYNKKTLEW